MKGKIFNAQEVQAILNGSKVMFREVIKPYPHLKNEAISSVCFLEKQSVARFNFYSEKSEETIISFKSPYQVGQKIFCKESFWQFGGYDGGSDGDEARFIGSNKITFCPEEAAKTQTLCKAWKRRPAQHMKQEHSRLFPRIKSVKVERLQDISEGDAVKEGFLNDNFGDRAEQPPSMKFRDYWNATHKKPKEKFEANPWVWVVNFEVVKN